MRIRHCQKHELVKVDGTQKCLFLSYYLIKDIVKWNTKAKKEAIDKIYRDKNLQPVWRQRQGTDLDSRINEWAITMEQAKEDFENLRDCLREPVALCDERSKSWNKGGNT